ncbi:MAG: iron ABC transporter permease [Eggerthellaceae bacterium]|nr:iron ABC transporter permease [Eggerthellaceae bacterium]
MSDPKQVKKFSAEDATVEGKKQVPLGLILIGCGIVVIVLAVASMCIGRYSVDVQTTLAILTSPFTHVDATWTANEYNVIMNIRLPRVIAAFMVGAALALSGASYQGVFQNPLVSPDILGVSYGACVGAALSILLYLNTWQTQIFAFVGGLVTVFITVSIPKFMHRHSNVVMVLSGVIVGGFMSSILGIMKYVADPDTQLAEITYWQLGSIAKVDFSVLSYTAPVMIVAAVVLVAMRWRLNLISLGEEEARSLGVDLRRERNVIIVAATLLTASAVSVAGTIGWVGLIIPHVTRRIVGSDNKRLIPTVILVAAAFMILVDLFARNISGYEIPLGILTGLIGAPIFGYILVKQRDID